MTGSSINFSAYGTSRNNQPAKVYPNDGDVPNQMNGYGELLVAQGTPQYLEECRQNELFTHTDATARAGVVAVPTTTSIWSLYNGEDIGGKCIIVDRITAMIIANTAAASAGFVMNMQKLVATAGTDVKVTQALGGMGAYAGKTRVINAATAVVADGWMPAPSACNITNVVASGFGATWDTGPLEGRLIVRPQRQLHLAMVASATNVTAIVTFWVCEKLVPGLV